MSLELLEWAQLAGRHRRRARLLPLGGLWFLPRVFGNRWTRAMRWDSDEDGKPGLAVYIGPFLTCLSEPPWLPCSPTRQAPAFGDDVVLGSVSGSGIAGAVLFFTGYSIPPRTSR